ncbi:hypothetical protein C475_05540 [Halosimplex carlsbadense 2-9-1]|uniref:Lipoprotein n=1 Tax=Halosimplex carlsbadense 2-9-1 TaxID=797114 RepID=M0D029_9EURY|nr:hypothetical protein [Halosimplex carlsbadense]ELZ28243.1 hypothetical protein C475_05540 [Halosimplex carlsbadense 2-9-1]
MPRLTRRRALQAAVGLAAGLAGCPDGDTDAGRGSAGTPVGSPTQPVPTVGDGRVVDPEYVTLRAEEADYDDPLAWFVPDPADRPTAGGTVEPTARETEGLVADEATAETFAVADRVTESEVSAGAETARSFVAETDFDSETLLVDWRPVEACYRLVLCHVVWNDGEVETRYGRFLRDADVACESGERDARVTIARLPAPLDPTEFEMGGSGVASGECFPMERERARPTARSRSVTETGPATATDAAAPATTDGGSR